MYMMYNFITDSGATCNNVAQLICMYFTSTAMGWAFWILCPPLALLCNYIRDKPQDPDDPFDWNDDPLRPWNYRVDLDVIKEKPH